MCIYFEDQVIRVKKKHLIEGVALVIAEELVDGEKNILVYILLAQVGM